KPIALLQVTEDLNLFLWVYDGYGGMQFLFRVILSSIPDRIKVKIDLNLRFLGDFADLNPAEKD
ncbi:hypothetical protein COCMIDRAFT_98356, partial [Bipolaris oryzae ATCC 44560]